MVRVAPKRGHVVRVLMSEEELGWLDSRAMGERTTRSEILRRLVREDVEQSTANELRLRETQGR